MWEIHTRGKWDSSFKVSEIAPSICLPFSYSSNCVFNATIWLRLSTLIEHFWRIIDLNQSITSSERRQVLQRALRLFSHEVGELHDYETNLGIDKALCLKLGYVVVTTPSGYITKEIVLICRCFTEIFKCSSTNRLRSFRQVGITELLPLLIQLWTNIIQSKSAIERRSSELDDGLVWIVRLLRIFSKLIPAKSYFINYLRGAFLGNLLRDILFWINEANLSNSHSSTEVLWVTLGLVKDLTFRSRTEDKQMLLHLEGEIFFKHWLFLKYL